MNRKDGGKEGRTREGALSWSPEENFRERGQGGGRQGWRQGGNGGKEKRDKEEREKEERGKEERGKEKAIFGVF